MQLDRRACCSYAKRTGHVHPTVDLQIVPQPDIPATRRSRSTKYHQGTVICRVLNRSIASSVTYPCGVVVSACKVDVRVPCADVSRDIQFPLWIVGSDADSAVLERDALVPGAIVLVVEGGNTASVGCATIAVYVEGEGLPPIAVDDADSRAVGLSDEGDVAGQRHPIRILSTEATRSDDV